MKPGIFVLCISIQMNQSEYFLKYSLNLLFHRAIWSYHRKKKKDTIPISLSSFNCILKTESGSSRLKCHYFVTFLSRAADPLLASRRGLQSKWLFEGSGGLLPYGKRQRQNWTNRGDLRKQSSRRASLDSSCPRERLQSKQAEGSHRE